MTVRKAFKKRVREQIEVTGQSYAQAAEQLERSNPALATPKTPGVQPDPHPASAVVVRLLKEAGLNLDPVTAFGVGGGIGFMYALFQYKEVPAPLLTLVCQHHPEPWATAILSRLEVAHTTATNKRDTQKLLDAGQAVMLPLARGSVPWAKQIKFAEREEIIVVATSASEDNAHQDLLVFDGRSEHRMSRTELLEAYAVSPRKHPTLAISEGAVLPADLSGAINEGLAATVGAMTGPVLGNSFDVNFGLSGLSKWSEKVLATTKDGWNKAYGSDESWRSRLQECIDQEHTARSAGRPLFAQLLTTQGLTTAAAHFERSGRLWRGVADRAATLSYEELAEIVSQIAAEETQGVSALANDDGFQTPASLH
ncbi:hypothetical protein G7066_07525 [Leucobacter coleopterorum]|uniref:Butirosin biosynthesis protein H, N-terminal n=1 Tax=Leucobacter coleopterorum TaxID=2714933 RepID=A0ABX6JW27_9MICO|nr:BtrH N-terminal domain-containing protein [Leucobacter coleopterorum]QIM18506.1 hypothetical protein G7066_07525 [Leucobacter coleopterorum]